MSFWSLEAGENISVACRQKLLFCFSVFSVTLRLALVQFLVPLLDLIRARNLALFHRAFLSVTFSIIFSCSIKLSSLSLFSFWLRMFCENFFALLIKPYVLISSLFAMAILRALSMISGLKAFRLWIKMSKASSNIGFVPSLRILIFFLGGWKGRRGRDSLGNLIFVLDFIFPLLKSSNAVCGPCFWDWTILLLTLRNIQVNWHNKHLR